MVDKVMKQKYMELRKFHFWVWMNMNAPAKSFQRKFSDWKVGPKTKLGMDAGINSNPSLPVSLTCLRQFVCFTNPISGGGVFNLP